MSEGWLEEVLAAPPAPDEAGHEVGRSREGRPVRAYRLGRGPVRVSLLAGCHADEPVGPRLLRRLCGWLGSLPPESPPLTLCEWWVVPHINPDGAARNRAWQKGGEERYDVASYLAQVVRELPGDDVEFGFPRGDRDSGARPENRAIWRWWREAERPFHLHVSLHGMGFGAGPWFLVEPSWRGRLRPLEERCRSRTAALGYRLHDVERLGEKGFLRLGPGFCTRPDSRAMRAYFLARGDPATAARFRPSSMEAVRALGGDPLTLVTEMPLFLTPGVGERPGPPDPAAERWRGRIERWRSRLRGAAPPDREAEEASVREEAREVGLRAMPVRDQMALQWTLVTAGLALVRPEAEAAAVTATPGGSP